MRVRRQNIEWVFPIPVMSLFLPCGPLQQLNKCSVNNLIKGRKNLEVTEVDLVCKFAGQLCDGPGEDKKQQRLLEFMYQILACCTVHVQ
jgi:hypothetical protein